MAGSRVEVQRDIVAEAAEVWSVLTDIDGTPRVLRSVEKVERLAGEGFDVGTRWREHRRFFGKLESEEMEVASIDPPRKISLVAESKGTVYRTDFVLGACSVGTRLRVTFAAESPDASAAQRLALSVMGLVGSKATKRALEEDLEDIASAVEGR